MRLDELYLEKCQDFNPYVLEINESSIAQVN